VLATDILKTSGVSDCNNGTSTIKVNNVDISFDRSTNNIDFDVSGTSEQVQYVTAELIVKAYGVQVYQKEFDPCDSDTRVDQLCPGRWHIPALSGTALTSPQCPREHLLPTERKRSLHHIPLSSPR
jgi:hypothetical protein